MFADYLTIYFGARETNAKLAYLAVAVAGLRARARLSGVTAEGVRISIHSLLEDERLSEAMIPVSKQRILILIGLHVVQVWCVPA